MKHPKWLTSAMVMALHNETLAMFGGLPGIRDIALLETALAKPRQLMAYEKKVSLFDLAGSYCFGVVRRHPFMDGNKRTGLLCARAFLFLNGYELDPEEADEVDTIMKLAEGSLTEKKLSHWLEVNSTPSPA
jgi:death on curing protein